MHRSWHREWLACLAMFGALLPVGVRADDPKVDAEFLEYLGGMETSTTNWTDVAGAKSTTHSAREQPVNPDPPVEATKSAPSADATSRGNPSPPAKTDRS